MEASCVRHTLLPNTSKLFADFLYHFDRVESFYHLHPADPESYEKAAAQVDFPDERRRALVAALRAQNGDSPLLDQLARPGTVAVVTGQQVGLFSGPSYTIYKALTAVKLARKLSERGIPAVPVFWLATEDHDFAEVNHCWTFDSGRRPVSLRVTDRDAQEQPVGGIDVAGVPLAQLRQSMAGLPFAADVAALVEQSYAPGRTFGEAFADLVKRLLGPYELLYLDPMQPAVRELAAPVMRKAVEQASELKTRIIRRNQELEAAGYHAQVHVEPQTSLFFLLDGGKRLALRRHNGAYLSGDVRYTAEQLSELAARLSPNALLRPVVQDYLLPTVAYIGGPAEIAYLAQSEVIYDAILGRMPVVAPRNGFTLLNSRSVKLMKRYGLGLPNFFHGEEPLREEIARHLVPESLARTFQAVHANVTAELHRLGEELTRFDPTLASALEKSRARIAYQLTKTERKIARETLRRNQRAAEEQQYLYHQVFPEKHLQERFYTILPFAAEHGLDLIHRVYENVQLDCPDHLVLPV